MLAIVREVSDAFPRALTRHDLEYPLDTAKARAQHRAYCDALRAIGFEVVTLPALEGHADCCFVEDTAIVAAGTALISRPGAESRRSEVETIASALAPHAQLVRMQAPATLDGGDCLKVGKRWYIGRSERTNAEGIAAARACFEPLGFEVHELAVRGALHLKSVCSDVGDRVLVARGTIELPNEHVIYTDELPASNAVALGRKAIVAAGFPKTARALRDAGYDVIAVDNSELRRADGALTCLSLRLQP